MVSKIKNRYSREDYIKKANVMFLSLDKLDAKDMVAHYMQITKALISKMRQKDDIFSTLFKRCLHMGSYFEGTRFGEATEFDLSLVMKFPMNYKNVKVIDDETTINGSAKIVMPREFRNMIFQSDNIKKGFKQVLGWCDSSHCLDQNRFRNWFKGVVNKTLNTMKLENKVRLLTIKSHVYKISLCESGPAITLLITVGKKTIDIDLVPSLVFSKHKYPGKGFRVDPFKKVGSECFYAIPKPVKIIASDAAKHRSWRIVFPEQEKRLLLNIYSLKNIVRLLKKLRETQGFHKIASYFIKTVFLWEIEDKNSDIWCLSLDKCFMYMLRRLHFYIKQNNLQNYWYPNQNLFEALNPVTLTQIASQLGSIIRDIDKNKTDNLIICKYILQPDELTQLVVAMD